ncbi:MAG TPA: NADH-quinone oxidoreductase subunit C [Candidatus Thermoplasmatota archaeon]|nr:NADH-quinone oxidoreductase subunit C [Candidatus Thermoplasmatota archaeon]
MADSAKPAAKATKPAAPPAPKPAAVAAAPLPVPPAPAAPAPSPAPKPSGDYAALAAETPGATYAVLEDGVGVLTVPGDELFTAARRVKTMGYPLLSLLSGYDRGDHLGVLYAFVALAERPSEFREFRLRVVMPKIVDGKPADAICPSLVDLFPAADWQERETWDLFGIRFEGHPDLRRMFLPEGWTGHPGRKDYKEAEQYVALREGEDVVVKSPEEGAW